MQIQGRFSADAKQMQCRNKSDSKNIQSIFKADPKQLRRYFSNFKQIQSRCINPILFINISIISFYNFLYFIHTYYHLYRSFISLDQIKDLVLLPSHLTIFRNDFFHCGMILSPPTSCFKFSEFSFMSLLLYQSLITQLFLVFMR